MSNPATKDPPISFRMLAMPELPPTRFVAQLIDPDAKTGKLSYHYYFTIVAGDQILVLSPSKYSLEPDHLYEALKPLVTVHDKDEIQVPDVADTLPVLRMLTGQETELELVMQLVLKKS